MRKFFLLIIILTTTICANAQVKTGLEVLIEQGFAPLAGKRIGLVTNPTGVDRNLVSTIDILNNAPDVNLVALFAPEHGVRGDEYAGSKVSSTKDDKTGIPVYSIYGSTRKPTKEMLSGLDAVVYDIQDNGCRSYTFISSLGLMMEACGENGIEVIVLDRPNPLGGEKVEGPYVEDGYFSFVGMYRIPYIYGLTVGELALMINGEGLSKGQNGRNAKAAHCDLTVIPMEGWSRKMVYSDTKLPWVISSPHIPSAETVFYYPASGIMGELSGFMSIGVGYTLPFQLFGAEWITDADAFAERLNSLNLPGVRFRPIHYQPFYGSGAKKTLHGVQPYFTDYSAAQITPIQFYVMQVVAELYPQHAVFKTIKEDQIGLFDKVVGSKYVRDTFSKNHQFSDIQEYWFKDVEGFKELSKRYYLY